VPPKPVVALVEDDPLLRMPLAYALQAAGFTVVSAADGPDALSVLEDPAIDVAVVDVRLPGRLDGLAALREARRRKPALKAVITSGFAAESEASRMGTFLAKPFRADQLIDALRSLMESEPPAD
jgi:DNA-binding response OmpR family regulator